MSMGEKSFFWVFVTGLFEPLGLSRFPVSDYRIFVAIPIMIFGILGLKTVTAEKKSTKFIAVRISFIVSWFALALYELSDSQMSLGQILLSIIILIFTIGISVFISRRKIIPTCFPINSNKSFFIVFILIISLISFGGYVVVSDMFTWHTKPWDVSLYQNFSSELNEKFPLDDNGNIVSLSIFDNLPEQRPSREITESRVHLSWKGYLDGSYMMEDYGGMFFKSDKLILDNETYKKYMLLKWTPIFLEQSLANNGKIIISDERFSEINMDEDKSITQIHYGVNDIKYKVSLDEPIIMVENEKYFSGWKAELKLTDNKIIEAIPINSVFRGWELPAGEYDMHASFEFPEYQKFQLMSIGFFIVWLFFLVLFWKKRSLFV